MFHLIVSLTLKTSLEFSFTKCGEYSTLSNHQIIKAHQIFNSISKNKK